MKRTIITIILSLYILSIYAEKANIVILYTNGLNGQIFPAPIYNKNIIRKFKINDKEKYGGLFEVSKIISKEKFDSLKNKSSVLVIDAGNSMLGNIESNILNGVPIIKTMNVLKYDLLGIGNRDLDMGITNLRYLAEKSNFDFICCNVASRETGKLLDFVKPYKIISFPKHNLKIGVTSYIDASLLDIIYPPYAAELKMINTNSALKGVLKELKKENTDFNILILQSKEKIFKFRRYNFDIIIPGRISLKRVYDKTTKLGNTIVGPQSNSKFSIGKLTLEYNKKSKKITDSNGLLVIVDPKKGLNISPKVRKYMDKLSKEITDKINQTVCKLENTISFNRYQPDSEMTETVLNAICGITKTNIGIINFDAIRNGLYNKNVTLKDIANALPFDNHLVTLKLTGDDIMNIISKGLKKKHPLITKGLDIEIRKRKIQNILYKDNPIENTKLYKIVTIDFLAAGGDDYKTFLKGKNIKYTKYKIRNALISYINTN